MSNLNKVMLIGRLTRDPEMRYLPSGQPMTSFGLATNRYQADPNGGERREFTDFHNIVAWNIGRRNLAEIVAQYLKKGSLVYIEGRLQTRSWEGQDGQKRRTTEVIANDVQFLDGRGGGESGQREPQPAGVGAGFASDDESQFAGGVRDVDPDDIPF